MLIIHMVIQYIDGVLLMGGDVANGIGWVVRHCHHLFGHICFPVKTTLLLYSIILIGQQVIET